MRTHLHRLGNSQAVVIPKPLLAHLGIERAVELELVEDHIEVRKPRERAREGWAETLSALPESALELGADERFWLDLPAPEIDE
ncbi:MAG: AbrB/MazE/SpoVT family DNA-binding domain-containing protein [Candidatus Eremiobacteraeota bacterium]|nr:AbrB/MazE/SpoVT family DNA-binding domain-containing protein [Candidatus Eremiobacteraeota bacterium]